jgi:hypothetical protein
MSVCACQALDESYFDDGRNHDISSLMFDDESCMNQDTMLDTNEGYIVRGAMR